MNYSKSLAAVGLVAFANAKASKPHVMSYAHQYDMIDNEWIHALMASVYDVGGSSEYYKDGGDGFAEIGWRMQGKATWTFNIAGNFFDYFYVNFKTTFTLAEGNHNIYLSYPDFIDEYREAEANLGAKTCIGTDFDASFIMVDTEIDWNFKLWELSFLDVFNGTPAVPVETVVVEEMPVLDETKTTEEMVVEEEQWIARLKQDCVQVDENGNNILDENGNTIPCEEAAPDHHEADAEEESGWTQNDFAVEKGEISGRWSYKPSNIGSITNLLQWGGFDFEWPLLEWCFVNDMYREVMMNVFGGFANGQWGMKESYSAM